MLKLAVEDNGSGIPDYARPRVFDKFFSLQRPGGGEKSTGLGLNFVKEVAILHNGAIKLENRAQKGGAGNPHYSNMIQLPHGIEIIMGCFQIPPRRDSNRNV